MRAARVAVVCGVLCAAGCGAPNGLEYRLATQAAAWSSVIVDYPQVQEADVKLVSEVRTITTATGPAEGIYRYQDNISDDLFSALWRTVDNLENRSYRFNIEVEFASNATSDCAIGGGNVQLKAGLLTQAPQTELDGQGWVRAAFDHGQQSSPGATFPLMGQILNALPGCESKWAMVTRKTPEPIQIQPTDGKLILMVGTESAFEGFHEILFVRVTLSEAK